MTTNSARRAPYLRNHTSYDFHLWYTFLKWFLRTFYLFYFFKILIFGVVRVVKGQKAVQNDNKFCPSRSIYQETYLIWFSFWIHIYEIVRSRVSFLFVFFFLYFFKILIFWVAMGEKGQKMVQNDKKFWILKHTSHDCHVG